MPKKVVRLPQVADPTIEEVLKQFIKDTAAAKGIRKEDKKGATELFIDCMNGYAHQSLSREEEKVFEHYYNLEGKDHKEFCQVFGPGKITENVGEFVGYFLIQKVMMPGDQMGEAAHVIAELCKWLVEKNIVPSEDAQDAFEKAERAAKQLPRAEDANRIIWELAQKCPQNAQEYVDFGHMTVSRIDKDSIWLVGDDGNEVGPVALPAKAAQLLELDWKINCALAKSRGRWHFAEVGNVYPD